MANDPSVANLYENAAASLGNLVAGDVTSAFRSFQAPATQSPEERKTWVQRLIGDKPGVLGAVLDTVSNPVVLMGLALSQRYPIATADRLLSFGSKMESYAKRVFPGMLWVQDFHETYRGTPLPEWFDYITRTNHAWKNGYARAFTEVLEQYEEKTGRKFSKETGIKISAYLDGLAQPNNPLWDTLEELVPGTKKALARNPLPVPELDHAELQLAVDFKNIMRNQFDRVRNGLAKAKKGSNRLGEEMASQGVALPGWRDSYFPHIESLSKETVQAQYEDWFTSLSPEARRAMGERAPLKQRSKQLLRRAYEMLPNEDHLKAAGIWNKELEDVYRQIGIMKGAGSEVPWRRYSMDLLQTAENYTRGMARTFAWSAAPPGEATESMGQKIFRELPIMESAGTAGKLKATMLKETYIPLATGRLSWEQAVPSLKWADTKRWAAEWIEKIPMAPDLKKKLIEPLVSERGITWQTLGSKIQGYMYLSTLGMNVKSALVNTLQTVLTTVPTIGPKYTAKGIEEVTERYGRYLTARRSGTAAAKAFEDAFPEFAKSTFDVKDPSYEKFVSLIEAEEPTISVGSRFGKVVSKLKETGLLPFQTSERFNRLTAFYGAYRKGLAELPGSMFYSVTDDKMVQIVKGTFEHKAAAARFAEDVARLTQFGGGPLSTPYGLLKGPFAWGPVRQFGGFPLRMLGFVAGPGMRLGGEGKFNPGTLGRALAGSGLAYGMAKHLMGADISGALVSGTLPLPSETGVFPGVPLVSPAVQVAGAAAKMVLTGDTEDLPQIIPLLVPFGVAGSRAVGLIPGVSAVGGLIGKPHADYNSRTPDGRIPVYSASGALQGYYSPTQLFARAVGIGDVTGLREQALQKYLLAQRDRLRDYRRQGVEAVVQGDMKKYQALSADYQRAYPGLGPLPIKKTDIQAYQMRMEVPRLERVFETLPAEMRPAFAGVVAASLGAQAPGFLGVDPATFGQSTISQRTKAGARPTRSLNRPTGGVPGPGTGQAGRGQIQSIMDQLGQNRRDDAVSSGYQSLDPY